MNNLEHRIEKLENELNTLKNCIREGAVILPQPTTPKPRCDAQGRLLEAPARSSEYYRPYNSVNYYWIGDSEDQRMLETGQLFISQPAAEAELTRLKCLQRFRGMEGFTPFGGYAIGLNGKCVFDGFECSNQRDAAEATITPEERAAFLYREPMGE